MESPIYDYCLDTNTLKPGKSYRMPFKFIVPEELPIHACQHQCANHQIQDEHLQLPASLSYRGTQCHKIHDMSPEMVEVVYSINIALRQRNGNAGKSKKIQEATHPVHILPTRNEHPPILVPGKNSWYRQRAEKSLSTGLLRHSRGKLAACSTQPPAIQLQNPQPTDIDASTSVKICLRFDPSHLGQLPPSLLAAEFQLRAMTFFGVESWQDYPNLSDSSTWGSRREFWSDYVALTLNNETRLDWKAQEEGNRTIFTGSIEACVSLPTHRHYPPTFHSCLVSRVYALKATLFYRVTTWTGSKEIIHIGFCSCRDLWNMRYASEDRVLRIVDHLQYNFVQAMQSSCHAAQCLFISYPRGPASRSDIRYNTFFGLYHNALFDQDSQLISS
ncbi:hypothetical protein N7465_005830 [Penicillium sp. CMV-2018d]|nr:hypothetical protein N7465_005830 [Penicillium sp. CMV-2018d]